MTKMFEEERVKMSMNMSSMQASRLIREKMGST